MVSFLATNKEIYEFAQKYYLLYKSDKTKEFEVDNGFAEKYCIST